MKFIFAGLSSLIIYIFMNLYIGKKGAAYFKGILPIFNKYIYWTLFFIIVFSYFIWAIGRNRLPDFMEYVFNIVGAYWMAAMVYLLIFNGIIDIFFLIARKTKFINLSKENLLKINFVAGTLVILIVAVIFIYGSYNASHAKVSEYNIKVDKAAGNLKKLDIVMISDIHLGSLIGKDRLKGMVNSINDLHPDIVLISGDIIDNDLNVLMDKNIGDEFLKLKSKYGTYAVGGNHDPDAGYSYLEKCGLNMLLDESVKIENSFYIVGRKDLSRERYNGQKRKSLEEILKEKDKSLPLILLDHQPENLDEGKLAKVDLQLSGHTHGGQFFPANLFTRRLFEIDHGYLKKDNFNVIVSCGYGTWGPPIRIGNSSEIVKVTLNFK